MARMVDILHRSVLAAIGLTAAARAGLMGRGLWLSDGAPGAASVWLPVAAAVLTPLALPFLPRFVTAPSRWIHLVPALGIPAALIFVATFIAAAGGLSSAAVPGPPRLFGLLTPFLWLALLATAIVAVATAPPVAPRGAGPATARPSGRDLPAVRLPDIGYMMKTYIVTDWILLRLCGGGLAGMAWMIYGADDPAEVAPILHDFDPQVMTWIYAAFGALLLMPFLLPAIVARPVTLMGGALKASILLGLSVMFMPALDLAVDLYVSPDYRDVLHDAVPKVFKAVAGIAVLSTMAIAFFRQLGGPPPTLDGMGNPSRRLSGDELREMRAARMQV